MTNANTNAKRILIIEDEKPIAKALKLKLESESFNVELLADGQTALDKIKEMGKSICKYDLILMDVIMPQKNGFDVLEYINKNKIKTPPIFVLSNLGQEEDAVKAKSLGASEFIIKSNTPLNLIVEKIKSYL